MEKTFNLSPYSDSAEIVEFESEEVQSSVYHQILDAMRQSMLFLELDVRERQLMKDGGNPEPGTTRQAEPPKSQHQNPYKRYTSEV